MQPIRLPPAAAVNRREPLLEALTREQFVHPHATLGEVLLRVTRLCPTVSIQTAHRHRLNPQTKIGRLRRAELEQLAHALARAARALRRAAPRRPRPLSV